MADAPKVYVPPTIEHADWDREESRVLLFSITKANPDYVPGAPRPVGSEPVAATITTDYTIPAKPHVGLGLAFLKYARNRGTELALSWLLEEAVGSEGYDALAAEPDLKPEALEAITRKARDVVLGGLEAPKG